MGRIDNVGKYLYLNRANKNGWINGHNPVIKGFNAPYGLTPLGVSAPMLRVYSRFYLVLENFSCAYLFTYYHGVIYYPPKSNQQQKTMTTYIKSFTRWAALCLLILPFLSVANSEPVRWNIDTHQPHFADINGDGVDDLLLQANTSDGHHSLVLGSKVDGSKVDGLAGLYLSSNQQTMPAKLAGSDWAVSQGKVTSDSLANLATPSFGVGFRHRSNNAI